MRATHVFRFFSMDTEREYVCCVMDFHRNLQFIVYVYHMKGEEHRIH